MAPSGSKLTPCPIPVRLWRSRGRRRRRSPQCLGSGHAPDTGGSRARRPTERLRVRRFPRRPQPPPARLPRASQFSQPARSEDRRAISPGPHQRGSRPRPPPETTRRGLARSETADGPKGSRIARSMSEMQRFGPGIPAQPKPVVAQCMVGSCGLALLGHPLLRFAQAWEGHSGPLPAHRRRRTRFIALGWLSVPVGLGLIFAAGYVPDSIFPILLFGGMMLLFAGPIVGIEGSRVLAAKRIDKNFIWMTGVSPEYLATFPDRKS